jgi:hypothetical protein
LGENNSNRLSLAGLNWVRGLLLLSLLAWVGAPASAQQPLTNQDVIQLVKGGLPESVILNAMANQPTRFDISAQALIALKAAGVSDKIIQQMLTIAAASSKTHVTASPSPNAPPSTVPSTPAASSPPPASGLPPPADLLPLLAATAVFATDFSAVQVYVEGPSRSARTEGNLYVGSGRLRFEEPAAAGKVVTIVDPQSMTGRILAPGKASETVRKFAGVVGFVGDSGLSKFFLPVNPQYPCARYKGVVSCKALGPEEVNSRPATKWEFKHGMGGQTWQSYEWIDSVLNIAVRRQFENHITELRDIKVATQPKNLFEMPSDPSSPRTSSSPKVHPSQ